jgi:hypothetical protein
LEGHISPFLFVFPALKLLKHSQQQETRRQLLCMPRYQLLRPWREIDEIVRVRNRVKISGKCVGRVECLEVVLNTESLMILGVVTPHENGIMNRTERAYLRNNAHSLQEFDRGLYVVGHRLREDFGDLQWV